MFRLAVLILSALAVVLVAGTRTGEAHPIPKPHSADVLPMHWICKAIGNCRDAPPRPGPTHPCNFLNEGEIAVIYDPVLGAYVKWRCHCDAGCRWVRIEIVLDHGLPWDPPHRRWVVDAQRACKSIVCKKVWVEHFYPSRWVFGR